MDNGHAELVSALDPLSENGAVARFLKSLREEIKNADANRAEQLSVALAARDRRYLVPEATQLNAVSTTLPSRRWRSAAAATSAEICA